MYRARTPRGMGSDYSELGLVRSPRTETGPHGLCCLIECTKIEHNQGLNPQPPDYHVTLSAQLTTLPNGLQSELCYLGNDHLLPTIYRGGVFAAYRM